MNKTLGAEEMAQHSRASTVLSKGLNSIPSTDTGSSQLRVTSGAREFETSLLMWAYLTSIHTIKNNKNSLF